MRPFEPLQRLLPGADVPVMTIPVQILALALSATLIACGGMALVLVAAR